MKTKLFVFDFDGTLMQSPEHAEGKAMYERMFGTPYPHKGWWGRSDSLHVDFDIQPHQAVLEQYNIAKQDPSAICILMTNRIPKMEKLILHHTGKFGIEFDKMFFSDGKLTKPQRLGSYLETLRLDGVKLSEITVYDDMDDQIDHYLVMRNDWNAWGSSVRVNILQMKDGALLSR